MVKGAGILLLLLCASYVIGEGTKDSNNIEQQDSHTKDESAAEDMSYFKEDDSGEHDDDTTNEETDDQTTDEDLSAIDEDDTEESNSDGNDHEQESQAASTCTYQWVTYTVIKSIPVYGNITYRRCVYRREPYTCMIYKRTRYRTYAKYCNPCTGVCRRRYYTYIHKLMRSTCYRSACRYPRRLYQYRYVIRYRYRRVRQRKYLCV